MCTIITFSIQGCVTIPNSAMMMSYPIFVEFPYYIRHGFVIFGNFVQNHPTTSTIKKSNLDFENNEIMNFVYEHFRKR